MEDLEDKEDFEEFEIRQKSEQAAQLLNQKRYQDEDGLEEDDEAFQINNQRRKPKNPFLDESNEDHYDDYDEEDDEDNIERDEEIPQGYSSDPELQTANRNVKFNRDRSSRRDRAQSAKGERRRSHSAYNDRNLRGTKITT